VLDNNRMMCQVMLVMRKQLSYFLYSLLALFLYVAVLPRLGLWLDRRLALIWRLPGWADPLAVVLMVAGAAFSLWYFWTLFSADAPLAPASSTEPVPSRSRSQLIFGAWMFGAGLGLLLRSASLMVLVGVIAIPATIYFRRSVQRASFAALSKHFGRLRGRIPAWLTPCLP